MRYIYNATNLNDDNTADANLVEKANYVLENLSFTFPYTDWGNALRYEKLFENKYGFYLNQWV